MRYTPLLQTPPLHLAILIAKDSPLQIDCPPSKFGGISSTHSSLDAAIAKFRMTAYMWQALTAEDLRAKGLGRRAFRLEEEWATSTLTRQSLHSRTAGPVPKVHLVRTEKTTAELRDANLAQQNPRANKKDELHAIFSAALLDHGGPFASRTYPIVAGLILDSHYNPESGKHILAHAALGSHDPSSLSLGMFGSHLTFSWPRFMEEVPSCLLDTTPTGDTVANDNGECDVMWRACAVGQGAFLHEVGHAFGAPHTSGIMERGYSPDWPKALLGCARDVDTSSAAAVTPETEHECQWDIMDALRFRTHRHFWMPGDENLGNGGPVVEVVEAEEEDGESFLRAQCGIGIGAVVFTHEGKRTVAFQAKPGEKVTSIPYSRQELEKMGKKSKGVGMEVAAANGLQCTVADVWVLLRTAATRVRVPGTKIRLAKQAVGSENLQADWVSGWWPWTVMLKKRGEDGNLVDASKIDIRVGCGLDGAVVYYKDGTKIPCGPRGKNGHDPNMGGHQARKIALPRGVEITKVAVTKNGCSLQGLRMWLSNGKAMGALNYRPGYSDLQTLGMWLSLPSQFQRMANRSTVPPSNHKIIGFYGTSGEWGMCSEFGIVTAPRDAVLPDSMYDMEELQNKPVEDGHRNKRRRVVSPSFGVRWLRRLADAGLPCRKSMRTRRTTTKTRTWRAGRTRTRRHQKMRITGMMMGRTRRWRGCTRSEFTRVGDGCLCFCAEWWCFFVGLQHCARWAGLGARNEGASQNHQLQPPSNM